MEKTLQEIHEDVPPDHYDRGVKSNLFQRYWHLKRIKKLRQFVFQTDGRILDVGCHSGYLTSVVGKLNPQAKIYGLDISRTAISLARKRLPKGYFTVANAHHLPFKEEFFDGVILLEILEHVEDPRQVLSEVHRVIKKGGRVLVLVPTDNLCFRLLWTIWNLYFKHWKHAHVQSFRKDSLEKLAKRSGFEIDKRLTFNLGMLKMLMLKR